MTMLYSLCRSPEFVVTPLSAAAVVLMPLLIFCFMHRGGDSNAFHLAGQPLKIVPSLWDLDGPNPIQ